MPGGKRFLRSFPSTSYLILFKPSHLCLKKPIKQAERSETILINMKCNSNSVKGLGQGRRGFDLGRDNIEPFTTLKDKPETVEEKI